MPQQNTNEKGPLKSWLSSCKIKLLSAYFLILWEQVEGLSLILEAFWNNVGEGLFAPQSSCSQSRGDLGCTGWARHSSPGADEWTHNERPIGMQVGVIWCTLEQMIFSKNGCNNTCCLACFSSILLLSHQAENSMILPSDHGQALSLPPKQNAVEVTQCGLQGEDGQGNAASAHLSWDTSLWDLSCQVGHPRPPCWGSLHYSLWRDHWKSTDTKRREMPASCCFPG